MKKRKWKDIRSAVVMMCVMIAMLSTATFAWFTMSENAAVTGLQMTAKTSGGLLISEDGTTWFSAVDVSDENPSAGYKKEQKVLLPATLLESDKATTTNIAGLGKIPAFKYPGYVNREVASFNAINTEELFNQYVASATYHLKNQGADAVNVGIVTKDPTGITAENVGLTAAGLTKTEGSFVVTVADGDSNTNDASAIHAVRVAFLIDNEELVIWEPNYTDETIVTGSTYALETPERSAESAIVPNVRSDWDAGNIMTNNAGSWQLPNPAVTTSGALFDIPGNDGTVKVDMFVWFEGKDPQCVDQIIADEIVAQVEFTVVNP